VSRAMRGAAYIVAAIAAVGIMLVIAKGPAEEQSVTDTTSTVSAAAESMETLTLSVPEMHCQFACFPKVKETLEQVDAVAEVTLAEQKDEFVLDNKQVIVKYKSGFNLDEALGLLADAGYGETELVQ
jgi:mercuric ion binding protein